MWKHVWERHRGATIGTIGGLFFGFIYLFFGFWNMLMFALIVSIGFYIGMKVDKGEDWFPTHRLADWLTSRKRRLK